MNEPKRGFWKAMSHGLGDIGGRMRPGQKDPEIEIEEFLSAARRCLDGHALGHARKGAAADLARSLRQARRELVGAMLAALSLGLGAERDALREAVTMVDWEDVDMAGIEFDVSRGIGSRRRELFQLWLSMEGALEFMVWLREQALAQGPDELAIAPLRRDLDALMGELFSQGLLEMSAITWRSPAVVLEKIMSAEHAYQARSWGDLKARLDKDRRVFASFHSGWKDEPLAFLEVALTRGMAKSVADIVGQERAIDPRDADTATYYSINMPHRGLKGLSFGEDLIRRAAASLRAELPHVKKFCSLSPVPGFKSWIESLGQERFNALCGREVLERLAKKVGSVKARVLLAELQNPGWEIGPLREASKEALERLCGKYLESVGADGRLLDPTARFHVENGGRLDALRHLGDLSQAGLTQSFGMMANYVYDERALALNSLSLGAGGTRRAWL